MHTNASRCLAGLVFTLWLGVAALGDFVPGRIYISALSAEGFPPPRIYEFDPSTGASSEFYVAPGGTQLTGLVFTPDGSRLRASNAITGIVEIDGDGNDEIVLDQDDGIFLPGGSNNLAYDSEGSFYVLNLGAGNVLKFPASGGPGELFVDVVTLGPIAPHPDGGVYLAADGHEQIFLFTEPGTPDETTLFDTLPDGDGVRSLTTDDHGNLFVLSGPSIYRYSDGDPSSRTVFASLPLGSPWGAITVSPDQSRLYVANFNEVFSVDLVSGVVSLLGEVPILSGLRPGVGIAVAVPEPASMILVLVGALALGARRTARRWETGASSASSALRARDELSGLARQFARAAGQNATDLWHWGRAFQDWFEAQWARPSLVMVGELIGRLSRGKLYGRQWVSRVLATVARFPKAPRTQQEKAEFLAAWHGHGRRLERSAVTPHERMARGYRQLVRAEDVLVAGREPAAVILATLQLRLHVRAFARTAVDPNSSRRDAATWDTWEDKSSRHGVTFSERPGVSRHGETFVSPWRDMYRHGDTNVANATQAQPTQPTSGDGKGVGDEKR